MSYLASQRAYRRSVAARHANVVASLAEARLHLREAKAERRAIVAGEIEGDAGIAWTNEERAEARVDTITDLESSLYQQLWDLDADIAEAAACVRAEKAFYAA